MKKIINLKLYNNDLLSAEYNNINSIYKDNSYSMILDDVKTTISDTIFRRETNDYKFEMDIKNKKALYTLKMNNTKFDIDVEKIMYKEEINNIIIEYKISSEEGLLKIVLEKGDNND